MLKSLLLQNFRNYSKFSLDFARTTILVGPNGIGKTNILEAIYLVSTGRSWRTQHDNETVRWQEELAKICATISNEKEENIELIIQSQVSPDYPQQKIVKVNGVRKRLSELLGRLPAVLFSPEEIQLVEGSPSLRRRALDVLLCQLDKKYTLALLELAKIIRGRNKLLFYIKIGRSKINELTFWDDKLVTLGSFIILRRQKLIENFNERLSEIYKTIAGNEESLKIKYKPKVEREIFAEMITANQEREIEQATTLFGPHRDDLIFLLDNRDISTFGSRGEYRSVILALKMAELEYLTAHLEGKKPILLLDDIFSELDANRRLHLAKIVSSQQTIITATDLEHLDASLCTRAKVVELK